ncbi:MAG: glyoxalase superfamily protein [Nitratireductor sp.]|nr:glyoxalase superfamily protein [Nitratireductor sp.]
MKEQARRLRGALNASGGQLSHAQALEMVAKQHGHRDWNTAHALAGNAPAGPPVELMQQVSGRYLGQAFTGTVIGVMAQGAPDRWKVTLQLDEPVDVVTFESFSAFRHRITGTINADRRTSEKTSNGEPHLVIDR